MTEPEGKLTQCLQERQGADAPVSLGTLALTKDGSQKRVKDTGELTKMADTNAPQKEPDTRSQRKF